MEGELEEQIEEVAELIVNSKRLVVLTGAGVSAESGIPDLRSMRGIKPDNFTSKKRIRKPEVKKKSSQMLSVFRMVEAVEPNPAHHAIAELDKMDKLDCIVTQNVDGLHQKAGVPEEKVIELHGTARWVKCLSCHRRYPIEEIAKRLEAGEGEPVCDDCGGTLKSATISFGEAMPVAETAEAERHARNCDLMLVVGSSLAVYPAAYMPKYAVESGAKLVIINVGDTPMDQYATVCIGEKAGEVMSRIVEHVKNNIA